MMDHTGGLWKHKSEEWALSAWGGAFFVPEVSTLSIGQH